MRLPGWFSFLPSYRSLYEREAERNARAQSEILDLRNREIQLLERAAKAEAERSEAYRQICNWQACQRGMAPIFGGAGFVPEPAPEPDYTPISQGPMTGAQARAKANEQFFEQLEREFRAQEAEE